MLPCDRREDEPGRRNSRVQEERRLVGIPEIHSRIWCHLLCGTGNRSSGYRILAWRREDWRNVSHIWYSHCIMYNVLLVYTVHTSHTPMFSWTSPQGEDMTGTLATLWRPGQPNKPTTQLCLDLYVSSDGSDDRVYDGSCSWSYRPICAMNIWDTQTLKNTAWWLFKYKHFLNYYCFKGIHVFFSSIFNTHFLPWPSCYDRLRHSNIEEHNLTIV